MSEDTEDAGNDLTDSDDYFIEQKVSRAEQIPEEPGDPANEIHHNWGRLKERIRERLAFAINQPPFVPSSYYTVTKH